ncbi:hypothetical protein MVEN_01612500 [Mycena venus]|uniref:DNA breaking-rejoining enzyme n=1 Tax=Mycena venus TaxID=2733690 RepID=A0A8H6XT06_9AGAR|nr:hypothetical protein MVEN_01612500 [Mycena venus]
MRTPECGWSQPRSVLRGPRAAAAPLLVRALYWHLPTNIASQRDSGSRYHNATNDLAAPILRASRASRVRPTPAPLLRTPRLVLYACTPHPAWLALPSLLPPMLPPLLLPLLPPSVALFETPSLLTFARFRLARPLSQPPPRKDLLIPRSPPRSTFRALFPNTVHILGLGSHERTNETATDTRALCPFFLGCHCRFTRYHSACALCPAVPAKVSSNAIFVVSSTLPPDPVLTSAHTLAGTHAFIPPPPPYGYHQPAATRSHIDRVPDREPLGSSPTCTAAPYGVSPLEPYSVNSPRTSVLYHRGRLHRCLRRSHYLVSAVSVPSLHRPSLPDPLPLDLHVLSLLPATSDLSGLMDVRLAAALSLPSTKPRKPMPGNEISPSPFRPHVAANQRILLWTTPHSLIAQKQRDLEVSRRLQTKMLEDVLAATVDDTRQAYGAGLLRFNPFCNTEGIPEGRCMPASEILLGAFISNYSGTLSGKAIRNWINGLRLWHIYNHTEWHGKEGWIPAILKGADKKGVSFKRPPRGPITLDHLRALRACLDLSRPRDAAIWAAALAAFWGCRRLGELLIKSLSKFRLDHDVARSTRMSRSKGVVQLSVFIFPGLKLREYWAGEAILTSTDDEFCPVWAIDNHLAINHSPVHDTPLFSFRDDSGNWTPLVKQSFLDFSSSIYKSQGLENVFGHSYRIGGSLQLLLDGVAPEIVMKVGGWTSLCFLIYWRRLEKVIPLHISKAWDAKIRAFASSQGIQHDILDINI